MVKYLAMEQSRIGHGRIQHNAVAQAMVEFDTS